MYRRSSCSFGNLRCVYCVAVFLGLCFGLFGGVVCPLVWCGVLVLLWLRHSSQGIQYSNLPLVVVDKHGDAGGSSK